MNKILPNLIDNEYIPSINPTISTFIKECYSESKYDRIFFDTNYVAKELNTILCNEPDKVWIDDDKIYIKKLNREDS